MDILIACEKSGVVMEAFRARGHNAWSCDLLPSDKGPFHHIMGDVLYVLQGMLEDKWHWDMLIAFPPCTYLCNSGVRWLKTEQGRQAKLDYAAMFFRTLLECDIPKKCIESSIPHKYAVEKIGRKYDQIIQPNQFGHPESKATCLWLENLEKLEPTNILTKPERGYWDNQTPSGQNKLGPSKDRATIRGTTYQGIADAMATQWG